MSLSTSAGSGPWAAGLELERSRARLALSTAVQLPLELADAGVIAAVSHVWCVVCAMLCVLWRIGIRERPWGCVMRAPAGTVRHERPIASTNWLKHGDNAVQRQVWQQHCGTLAFKFCETLGRTDAVTVPSFFS